MRPGEVERCGGDVADAAFGDQLRRGVVDELSKRSVVGSDLGVEELDPLRQRSHGDAGGLLVNGAARTVTELGARRDLA
jgi:hypothetical protein